MVVSEEELSLARPRHARRLVAGLAGHRVFVLGTARDMARTVVSAWQQAIINGAAVTWADFVASARGLEGAPPVEGLSFHWRHDVLRVLDTWGSVVPPENLRLVTVPPAGSAGTVLLSRFAAAAHLPAGWPWGHQQTRNAALGAAELEVVRRLNESVAGRLNPSQHRFVVEAGIHARLAGHTARPLELPTEHLDWARSYGEALVAELRSRGTPVLGDLADLVPPVRESSGPALDEVDDAELLAAAQAALGSLALDHGQLFRRYRRECAARDGRVPGVDEMIASQARAVGFTIGRRTFRMADDNAVLAWALRSFVEWRWPTTRLARPPTSAGSASGESAPPTRLD